MALIKDILRTMDYGPSPESSEHARPGSTATRAASAIFIDGRFTKPGALSTCSTPRPASASRA